MVYKKPVCFEIGEQIVAQNNHYIEDPDTGKPITIMKGDRGWVDANGYIHYLTGKAKGMTKVLVDFELDGFNTEHMARLIGEKLLKRFPIDKALWEANVSEDEFIRAIEDNLTEIFPEENLLYEDEGYIDEDDIY